MKRLARLLAANAVFLGILTLIKPRGWVAYMLAVPKIIATAFSPFLLLTGGLAALLGRRQRDPLLTSLGLLGAALAARYIARVTADHDDFDRLFGRDWQAAISPSQSARMRPKRYQPLVPAPADAPWQQNVVFDSHWETGDPLLADIWQPPAGVAPSGLGIIYLHGSAWHYADKDQGTRPFFRHLANQGHVIMDVAYTLAPKASLVPMVADVKRAIAWLKANGPAYGVNPARIVLMGGSAGAHLALLAAYTPNHPLLQPADVQTDTSVRAVVSYYGAGDLQMAHETCLELFQKIHTSRFNESYEGVVRWLDNRFDFHLQNGQLTPPTQFLVNLCGGTPAASAGMYRLGSPLSHVGPHCPPTLLLQGAHDLIFGRQSRPLYEALQQAGIPVIYRELPNTEHGFDLLLPRIAPAAQTATYDVERFLALLQ